MNNTTENRRCFHKVLQFGVLATWLRVPLDNTRLDDCKYRYIGQLLDPNVDNSGKPKRYGPYIVKTGKT